VKIVVRSGPVFLAVSPWGRQGPQTVANTEEKWPWRDSASMFVILTLATSEVAIRSGLIIALGPTVEELGDLLKSDPFERPWNDLR